MGALPLKAVSTDPGCRVAAHALNRLGDGPRPGDVERVLAEGDARRVEEQLEPGADPELDTRLAGFGTLDYPTSQVLALYNADNRTIGVILDEFFSAKVVRAVHARNQLQEVLVDFWFNHFNVFVNDGFDRLRDLVLRARRDPAARARPLPRAAGRVTAAPGDALLPRQLPEHGPRQQGGRSVGGINENHGRELLELHTVGVDAGYTQTDVVEASRCLTGHGIDNIGQTGNYRVPAPPTTTTAPSRSSGWPSPRAAARATSSGCSTHLASHPATAHFIAGRLAQRFVADDPRRRWSSRLATCSCERTATCARWCRRCSAAPSSGPRRSDGAKARTGFEFVSSALRAAAPRSQNTRAAARHPREHGHAALRLQPADRVQQPRRRLGQPLGAPDRMNFGLDLAAGRRSGSQRRHPAPWSERGGDPATRARSRRRSTARSCPAARSARRGTRSRASSAFRRASPRGRGAAVRGPRDAGEVRR